MANKYEKTAKQVLDLHNFTKREAEKSVLEFLNTAEERGYDLVRIITGKGLHSESGPVLRDFVVELLREQGYDFKFSKISEGGEGAIDVLFRN